MNIFCQRYIMQYDVVIILQLRNVAYIREAENAKQISINITVIGRCQFGVYSTLQR